MSASTRQRPIDSSIYQFLQFSGFFLSFPSRKTLTDSTIVLQRNVEFPAVPFISSGSEVSFLVLFCLVAEKVGGKWEYGRRVVVLRFCVLVHFCLWFDVEV